MKNSLDGLIKRLDMVNKRISELEDISIETSQSEIQRKKDEREREKKAQNVECLRDDYK